MSRILASASAAGARAVDRPRQKARIPTEGTGLLHALAALFRWKQPWRISAKQAAFATKRRSRRQGTASCTIIGSGKAQRTAVTGENRDFSTRKTVSCCKDQPCRASRVQAVTAKSFPPAGAQSVRVRRLGRARALALESVRIFRRQCQQARVCCHFECENALILNQRLYGHRAFIPAAQAKKFHNEQAAGHQGSGCAQQFGRGNKGASCGQQIVHNHNALP